jgi:hypothetical protein
MLTSTCLLLVVNLSLLTLSHLLNLSSAPYKILTLMIGGTYHIVGTNYSGTTSHVIFILCSTSRLHSSLL